ncbi:hypothetical protein [Achromobacter xylosoxidans]|uniref:hypothetical protein n=1 Tax=Alcaligenes xylosoxydans xylosoxydans TaxID=85698 RepID=UPI001EE9BBEA|nr:hypothetical protein [Achromobacter xylosoxidans]
MLKESEKMTRADWVIVGIALGLFVPPVMVVAFLNKASVGSFVISVAGREYFLSYVSFWFAAMAGLTAARGVFRHQRGQPKVDLAEASRQDYIESVILLFLAAFALALSKLDEPLPHRAFLWLLSVYPILYFVYLLILSGMTQWYQKRQKKGGKTGSPPSDKLRRLRGWFLVVSAVVALVCWGADWRFY